MTTKQTEKEYAVRMHMYEWLRMRIDVPECVEISRYNDYSTVMLTCTEEDMLAYKLKYKIIMTKCVFR